LNRFILLFSKNSDNQRIIIRQKQKFIDMLQNEQILQIESENYTLDKTISVQNIEKQKKFTKNIFLRKTLVLFVSSTNCNDCSTYCLSVIKNDSYSNSKRIIVFASGYSIRDLFVFYKSNKFNNSVYSLTTLGLPIEKLNMPFMFLIDDKLTPTHFFIPRKEMPYLTDKYLSLIKKQLE